jgi:ABC-type sugar transport system ATPase subunit
LTVDSRATNDSAQAAGDVLEMRGITKEFPGVRALDDVTLQVRRGHIHALLGENGAGKSTLMKILDGVYPAGTFQGEMMLAGVAIQLHSPHDAQRKGIGYVPQEITVIEGLTVAENIFVGHWVDRGVLVSFRNLFARATQFLKQININLDPHRLVSSLNASQRQLVMIARAMSTNPSVLILDESTACLTQDEADNLFRILRLLQQQGVTSLISTHKLSEVFDLADRATVMRDGAVVAHFDRSQFNEDDIVSAMIGRKIENFYPARDSAVRQDEVLRVENLTVPHPHIANKNVVEAVSFAVRRGEILGIGGLVGSGRSEIVNALYGRLPCSGRIFIEGREVKIRNPRDAKNRGIGLLTEERKQDGLLFNFAIRENVTLHSLESVSRFRVLDRKRETQLANDYKERLAIRAPSVATSVSTLSGGNQQKVVLAKVLLPKPKVLLLDEPTKGVDVGAKNEIYKLMMDLVRQGIALVVISSELPELLALCDRFIVLTRGKLADQFAKAEASEHRLMLAATGLTQGREKSSTGQELTDLSTL